MEEKLQKLESELQKVNLILYQIQHAETFELTQYNYFLGVARATEYAIKLLRGEIKL